MEIVCYPHPALLTPTREVTPEDAVTLGARIRELFRIMYEGKGIGLAAPQVAWNVRLFVMNSTGEAADERVLINPRILRHEGSETGEEGCLSFPGIFAKISRAAAVTVAFLNERGEASKLDLEGLEARIVQHELDHLENILLIHRMSPAEKIKHRRQLKELRAQFSP